MKISKLSAILGWALPKRRSFSNRAHSFASQLSGSDIGLIGFQFNQGQPHPGVAEAPMRLREAGLVHRLENMGYQVFDHGDLVLDDLPNDTPMCNIKMPRSVSKNSRQVSEAVEKIIRNKEVCLSIGGDHSMAAGTVHGHLKAQPDTVVVWVDAHADINPPLASKSGNFHGMVLSFLVHELQDYVPHIPIFDWLTPCLHSRDLVYIGLRDLDQSEKWIMEQFGIQCFTMHDIDHYGISNVIDQTIRIVNPTLSRPMHLSYDIDSIDPAIIPSTGTPVNGGLTLREGMYIAKELAKTGTVTGIDLVEVNPQLGSAKDQAQTIDMTLEIVSACFGKGKNGYLDPSYTMPKVDNPRSVALMQQHLQRVNQTGTRQHQIKNSATS